MKGSHLCGPSYDHTGKCKFCGHSPCSHDEAHPHFKPPVIEKIFFSRRTPLAPVLATAAAAESKRGSWVPRSDWGKASVMGSLSKFLLDMDEEDANKLLS